MDGTIGMVLSGGGARGAYEFGALEVLAPVLDEPPRIIVGTSAGALGAAYLAANAHDGLEAAARSGRREVARGRDRRRHRPAVLTARARPAAALRARAAGRPRARPAEPARHQPAAGDDRGADRFRAARAQRRGRHARHGRRRGDRLRDGEERGLPLRRRVAAHRRPARHRLRSRPGSRSSTSRPRARSSRCSRPCASVSAGTATAACGSTRR